MEHDGTPDNSPYTSIATDGLAWTSPDGQVNVQFGGFGKPNWLEPDGTPDGSPMTSFCTDF
jgi:hypothetical protein